jgi:flagellar assembly protein FliH
MAGGMLTGKPPGSGTRSNDLAYQRGFLEGEQKGRNDGQKAAFEQALKKIEAPLSALRAGLLQLQRIRHETYRRIENEVVKLAMAIAEKVICREINTDRETVVWVAKEALARVKSPDKLTIKMNPEDLPFLSQTQYQISDFINNIEQVNLVAEAGIERGGCIVETDSGEIDARVEKQLQAIEESFKTAMAKNNPGGKE